MGSGVRKDQYLLQSGIDSLAHRLVAKLEFAMFVTRQWHPNPVLS